MTNCHTLTGVKMLIIVCLICGLVLGYIQGMVMIQRTDPNHKPPIFTETTMQWLFGVRGHRYFKYYHSILLIGVLLLIWVGAILAHTDLTFRNFLIVAGSLIMAWELFEIAYNFARYNKLKTEHLVLFDVWHRYLTKHKRLYSTLQDL